MVIINTTSHNTNNNSKRLNIFAVQPLCRTASDVSRSGGFPLWGWLRELESSASNIEDRQVEERRWGGFFDLRGRTKTRGRGSSIFGSEKWIEDRTDDGPLSSSTRVIMLCIIMSMDMNFHSSTTNY